MKKTFKFSAKLSILVLLVCIVAFMATQVYAAEAGSLVSNPIILTDGVYYEKNWTNSNQNLNCYNKITISSKGYITFTIEKPFDSDGEIGSFDLELFNQNGEVIWNAMTVFQKTSFSDSYVYKIGLDEGTYFMNLDPNFYVLYNSAPILSRYKYDFTSDLFWEAEPNYTVSDATDMSLNSMYSGCYGEESRDIGKDYFSVNLEQGKKYAITIENYDKVDSGSTLIKMAKPDNTYREVFNYKKIKNDGITCSFLYTAEKAGTHYVLFDNKSSSDAVEYKVGVYEYACEHTPKEEATCISKAVCSLCGESYGEVDATKHGYLDTVWGSDPTCTEPGTTDGKKCEDCGAMVVPQEVITATGHKISKEIGYPATCTSNGLTDGEYYSDCYETITEQKAIPATGHTIVAIPAKKSTYTSTGLTAGKKCKTCGTVTVKQKKVAKKKLKKVTISSVKSTKAKQATVNWKTVSDSTGYIVEYSTSKKFTKKTTKKVTVKKAKSKKTTLKKLKSGKKYYIRIRAYKTVGKKTVYGAYSSVKTVKIK